MKKIEKVLVANRGEIAIRVFRACTELKIQTVAVYTFEDRYSLHRYKADESYQIGKDDEALQPYLNIEEIIQVAKRVGVDAIHPGYGFLSENVDFVRRCNEEGIIFIGPSAESMRQLGDKIAAKKIARKAGVPIIQSNSEPVKTIDTALAEANKIGYPIMVKAAAGGGGRGMRVVHNNEELESAFVEARSEAGKAFGNDTIFFEKFIANPKHIEVQILGDHQGNIIHLFERDCSVQRRFQKIVEVAPAPSLSKEVKESLYDYALKIAREVDYYNAGTVEFLVEDDDIYFIEVNPRIQVEHTVTEEVTGIDLVRSQILLAAGHSLQSTGIYIHDQNEVQLNGFAIQCRITTEDPKNNFQPDYGTIIAYRNAGGFGIRIDEGSSYPGVTISPFFDSMLAKVTAHGRTLKGAARRLHRTLAEYRIRGVKTNIAFLQNILENETFSGGLATVKFIQSEPSLFNYTKRQDRATRALRYLAEVSVNGHPNIPKGITKPIFEHPVLPDYPLFESPKSGTKQTLEKLGADGFSKWLKEQKSIQITDTTLRDAHQSLLATRVRTRDMVDVARAFAHHHPQTFSMEVWGGATFDVAMRFLNECPWHRLKQIREAVPNILLQMLLRGSNAIGYTAYPDNLVQDFIIRSWETGVDIFRIFDSLNWIENMRYSIRTVREHTGGLAEASICYTGDVADPKETKYTLQYYTELAKALEDAGAHIIAIKDMAGLLKPYAAVQLIEALKNTTSLPIHLHTHDTSSAQLATYLKAIEAGVDVVDVALASMSGLTSQPNFNTLIEIIKSSDRAADFDVNSLNQFSLYWEKVRKYYFPFESGLQAGTAEVYQHEIPGGQYSNLKPQAESLQLGHRLEDIKKTYSDVNDLFGNIVKVTPSSKVVGDLALFMVANDWSKEELVNGAENIDFPESVKNFFRGDLGQPYQGFPAELQKKVLKGGEPIKERAGAHFKAVDLDKEYDHFKAKFEDRSHYLDFLSHQFYPKVFENFYHHFQDYGKVEYIPTPEFFFGLSPGEETMFAIASGKTILIKLLYIEAPDAQGYRSVAFKLNGKTRTVRVKDQAVSAEEVIHQKAGADNEIGSPLQGLLSKIEVSVGDEVAKNDPLFIIEAMKMETTVTAPFSGKVESIVLTEGTMVAIGDLVVQMAS